MTTYAECESCKQPMVPGGACAISHERMGDLSVVERIKHGDEETMFIEGMDACPDCNVAVGAYHHPGCDREECPKCHRQAFGCEDYLTPEERAA